MAFLNLMFLTMSIRSASNLSISSFCGWQLFDKAKQHYEDALKRSGHTTNFTYMTNGTSTPQQCTPSHHRKNRQRKIIWFNPPYSRNVQTNVGKAFLGLITDISPPVTSTTKSSTRTQLKLAIHAWTIWKESLRNTTKKY